MGRKKLEIKKLEKVGRQITFSKRRTGITKKARELSILCDVDVLLVIFTTAGKPTLCLGEKSTFEGVIYRYAELSAQARNKRKLETLKALKKAFKNVDHDVNIEQLKDPDSYQLEEVKRQLLTCRDEITEALSFLGPLAEFDTINQIEDINKITTMQHKINDLVIQNEVHKENARNYAKYVMNKPYQLKEEPGSFLYTGPDGQKIKNRRDLAEYSTGYEAPVNYPTQDITWVQVDETQHTITDELPGLRHLPINILYSETPLCMESIKMNEIPIAKIKGGVSENCNGNQNQFMCQGQEKMFTMNAAPFEAGSLDLQEMSGNESSDFVDDILLEEDNVNNHGVTKHNSIIQTWTSGD